MPVDTTENAESADDFDAHAVVAAYRAATEAKETLRRNVKEALRIADERARENAA